jgi:hypothetical protein
MIAWFGLCISVLGVAYGLAQVRASLAERHLLRVTLARLGNDDAKRVNEARPLLRYSAEHILKTGFGFCGENARVAIRLLAMGGVRAHRLYLEGPLWQHNVVEHEWEGSWKLFDAHSDPASLLPDEDVGAIESSDIARFPNHHEGQPWLRSYRIKPFHRVPALRRFEQTRVPGWVAQIAETPSLIKAMLGLLGASCGVSILWFG